MIIKGANLNIDVSSLDEKALSDYWDANIKYGYAVFTLFPRTSYGDNMILGKVVTLLEHITRECRTLDQPIDLTLLEDVSYLSYFIDSEEAAERVLVKLQDL